MIELAAARAGRAALPHRVRACLLSRPAEAPGLCSTARADQLLCCRPQMSCHARPTRGSPRVSPTLGGGLHGGRYHSCTQNTYAHHHCEHVHTSSIFHSEHACTSSLFHSKHVRQGRAGYRTSGTLNPVSFQQVVLIVQLIFAGGAMG